MFERIGDFLEDHPGVSVGGVGAVLVTSYVITAALIQGNDDGPVAYGGTETPTGLATADAFPEPGETATQIITVRRPDGSIATRTVRAFTTTLADGQRQVIRETVREPVPGVFVTSTATIVESGPTTTSLVSLPGTDTTQIVSGPGFTETIVAPPSTSTETATLVGPGETVIVAGPTSTETIVNSGTDTVEVTVPGPETTKTETATERIEVTVPGPERTVTVTETVLPPLP